MRRQLHRHYPHLAPGAWHYSGVHGHPVQGHVPHDPNRHAPEETEEGPFDPYGPLPAVWGGPPAGIAGWTSTAGPYGLPPGPFAGVGPKGYARSDERVFEEVCDHLTEHGEIDVHDIEVTCKNGEVTLEGIVSDRWTKREVEAVVDSVTGVVDVHNRLRVKAAADQAKG